MRLFSLTGLRLGRAGLASIALLSLCAAPGGTAKSAGSPADRVQVRAWNDGAGPSHVIAMGDWVLVVDPREAQIRRYRRDDLHATPHICTFPRSFAPWRTVRDGAKVRLIAEPNGLSNDGRYFYSSKQTMVLAPDVVDQLPEAGPCGFPIIAYDRNVDVPPAIRREGAEIPGAAALFPLPGGGRARIDPLGGRRADIYAVRFAGALGGGRSLLWWSEIDAFPIEHATAHSPGEGPGFGGRVTASQYVGVFDARGGKPLKVIRIQNASYAPLVPSRALPRTETVGKLGFEYIAGGVVNGEDVVWIVALDARDSEKPFMLRRYAISAVAPAGRGSIVLTEAGVDTADRNDTSHQSDGEVATTGTGVSVERPAWFEALRPLFERQAMVEWRYPAAAYRRPCGDDANNCVVGVNAAGALGTGPDFAGAVDGGKRGPTWMRPLQLVQVGDGSIRHGVPYSIGGYYWAGAPKPGSDFILQRDADYDRPTANPRPIGHIREGMKWSGSGEHYPLGIDCSMLVARIFGVEPRGTADMLEIAMHLTNSGARYALPQGASGGCPQPVRHLSEIQPGDLLLHDGHVVVYSRTARIGGANGGSRGLRVFESSSRCGGVCESVYDPTSFDGWWILRMGLGKNRDEDCPHWLDAAAVILAESEPR